MTRLQSLPFALPLLLLFAPSAPSQARWEMEHDGLPNIKAGAMVADIPRGKVVLFGGPYWFKYRKPRFSVVWEWNGKGWDPYQDPSGPAWRDLHSMAYDWVNKGVLLYGGYKISFKASANGSSVPVNDTWIWKGRAWTNLKPKSLPNPVRSSAAMASNLATKKIVLFGGEVGISAGWALNDTWIWDGVTWKQVFPKHIPPSRKGHSMTYDPSTNRILMFGGYARWGAQVPRKDLWAWDGKDWTLLDAGKSGGPGHRIEPGFAAIPGRKGVYLWGGHSFVGGRKDYRDVWHWDGKSWRQVAKDTGPTVFDGSNGAWVPGTSSIIAIGKKWPTLNKNNPRDETWEFNAKTNAWRVAEKSAWDPQVHADGLAMDVKRDRLLTLAPEAPSYLTFYTWVKEPGKHWRKLPGGTGPTIASFLSPSNASLLSMPALDLVMFHFNGGQGWETWLWNGKKWTQDKRANGFPPTAKMVFDPRGKRVLAFGLRTALDYSLWEWTLSGGWKLLVSKVRGLLGGKSVGHWLAYDPVRDRLVLYYSGFKNYIYEWDGKTWTVFKSPQIPDLGDPYFIYHPDLEGCVLFGGTDSNIKPSWGVNPKTWLWKGGNLTRISSAILPETRSTEGGNSNGATFDPNRNLLWISYRGEVPTSLWKFKVGSLQTDRSVYHLGEKVLFDVNLPKQASHVFVGFLSLGQTPMIPVRVRKYFGVQSLPLAPDLLFQASMGFGLFTPLSGTGKGRYTLPIPQDKGLLGLHLFGSGVSFGPKGLSAVADQVAFRISR